MGLGVRATCSDGNFHCTFRPRPERSHVRLAQSVSGSGRSPVGHIRRWLIAWLIVAALPAVLLLANSVRDYLFVWRILATQQVRHQMAGYAVALE